MTDKELVVSLEEAKLLKEAGFPQDSYFVWVLPCPPFTNEAKLYHRGHNQAAPEIAAPTVAEILKELPVKTTLDNYTHWLEIKENNALIPKLEPNYVYYDRDNDRYTFMDFKKDTPLVEALSQLYRKVKEAR